MESAPDPVTQDSTLPSDFPTTNQQSDEPTQLEETVATSSPSHKQSPSSTPLQPQILTAPKPPKLQAIKDKVTAMIRSTPKVTLDAIKFGSMEQFRECISLIDKPEAVTHFSKNNSRLGDQILSCLRLQRFKSLEFLSLENAGLTPEGFMTLVELELNNLKQLYLGNNQIRDCEVRENRFPSLSLLSLSGNNISGKGVEGLRKLYKNLESLSLKSNPIGKEGVESLWKEGIKNLKYLRLDHCSLDSSSFASLPQAQQLGLLIPSLSCLYLNHNPLGKEGLSFLLQSALVTSVQTLSLQGSIVGEDTILFKQHEENIQNLSCLNLACNKLDDKLLMGLSKVSLPKVVTINLKSNNLSIESVKRLSQSELPQLVHLLIEMNPDINVDSSKIKALIPSFQCVVRKNLSKIHLCSP